MPTPNTTSPVVEDTEGLTEGAVEFGEKHIWSWNEVDLEYLQTAKGLETWVREMRSEDEFMPHSRFQHVVIISPSDKFILCNELVSSLWYPAYWHVYGCVSPLAPYLSPSWFLHSKDEPGPFPEEIGLFHSAVSFHPSDPPISRWVPLSSLQVLWSLKPYYQLAVCSHYLFPLG